MQDALNLVCGLPDGAQVRITRLEPSIEFQWLGTASFLAPIGRDRPWFPIWAESQRSIKAALLDLLDRPARWVESGQSLTA